MANDKLVYLRHLTLSAMRCSAMVTSKISELTAAISQDLEELDDAKQDRLTFDNTPTEGSNNPVTSGGIHSSVATRVPLAGGTMTGDLVMTNNKFFKFESGAGIRGTSGGFMIVSGNANAVMLRPVDSNTASGVKVTTAAAAPEQSNVMSLGSADALFSDVYLAGNLSDGTNRVAVADIASKSDIATAIGDIGTILDEINGEVV